MDQERIDAGLSRHADFLANVRTWISTGYENEEIVQILESKGKEELHPILLKLMEKYGIQDAGLPMILGAVNVYFGMIVSKGQERQDANAALFESVQAVFNEAPRTKILHEEAQHALLRAIIKAASAEVITAPELVELSDAYLRLPAPGEDADEDED